MRTPQLPPVSNSPHGRCKHCDRLVVRFANYRPDRTVNCRKGHSVVVGQPHPECDCEITHDERCTK
jgi:hypothetical protein